MISGEACQSFRVVIVFGVVPMIGSLWEIIGAISSRDSLIYWAGKKDLTRSSLFIYNALRLSLKYISI